jgi:hypothetical protein
VPRHPLHVVELLVQSTFGPRVGPGNLSSWTTPRGREGHQLPPVAPAWLHKCSTRVKPRRQAAVSLYADRSVGRAERSRRLRLRSARRLSRRVQRVCDRREVIDMAVGCHFACCTGDGCPFGQGA